MNSVSSSLKVVSGNGTKGSSSGRLVVAVVDGVTVVVAVGNVLGMVGAGGRDGDGVVRVGIGDAVVVVMDVATFPSKKFRRSGRLIRIGPLDESVLKVKEETDFSVKLGMLLTLSSAANRGKAETVSVPSKFLMREEELSTMTIGIEMKELLSAVVVVVVIAAVVVVNEVVVLGEVEEGTKSSDVGELMETVKKWNMLKKS